ncbi:hypothetical protein IT398_02930 [Candidatus Nomurabacteria bacterium]|nr:hypothetical protein [Candidatus Nomurabacteria bacterium]
MNNLKKKIDYISRFLGGFFGLVGLVVLFVNWKLGVTLLMVYYLFATASIWLMDDDVPGGTRIEVADSVKNIVAVGKKRASVFALIGVTLTLLVWFYF